MRFAALADIHGNHSALKAVLNDIARLGIRDVVNLGDSLSGPLEAGQTADLLLLLDPEGAGTVRGNHDRYLLDTPPERMGSWESDAHPQLAPRHLQWLSRLPTTQIYRDAVFLCHATPASDEVYWLERVSPEGHVHLRSLEEIEALASGVEQMLILCGHSHVPRLVQLSDGRLIVNPGSVGCPAYEDDHPVFHKVETGHAMASYAVLEQIDGRWLVQFRNVPYDHMAMSRLAASRGRQDWASALASGRV
jgi:diadenosine tetraphosphatase ApaH/serine/threonine PP2A family protein phosphatase